MPVLEAVASATPERRVSQQRLRDLVGTIVEEEAPELVSLLDVFDSTGIQERGLAAPLDWYLSSPGWEQRAAGFEEKSIPLASRVIDDVLAKADLPREGVDAVVAVNTTGIATPSLDALVVNRLGFEASTLRVPLWGYGCAGGVAGLARAREVAKAHPRKRVLLLSLELCSLAFLTEDISKKSVVAASLFGDGAAAALVAGDELDAQGPRVGSSASRLWPDTEEVMGWQVLEEGLGVVFSAEIPRIIEQELPPFVESFLKREGLSLDEVRPVFHPGGPKVLEAYERSLGLDVDDLATSRAVLERQGNMSSPTVLFALEAALEERQVPPGGPLLLGAVGPGFAGELLKVGAP